MVLRRLASNLSTSLRIDSQEEGQDSRRVKAPAPKHGLSSIVELARRRRSQARRAHGRDHLREIIVRVPKSPPTSPKSGHASPHSRRSLGKDGSGKRVSRETTPVAGSSTQAQLTVPVVPHTSFNLPKRLHRPAYREVAEGALAAIDPELGHTPPQYIRDILQTLGVSMMAVLASTTADPVKDVLPREIPVVVSNLSSDLPTHLLAIHAGEQTPSNNRSKNKVTLVPTHAIVLAAFCANMPALPRSRPSIPEDTDESSQSVTIPLPVIPLCIPSPDTFPLLCTYLYARRTDLLLTSLISCSPPTTGRDEASLRRTFHLLARRLSVERTTVQLLQHATRINAFWRNVCALGVFDEQLWIVMDVAWEVILTALTIKTTRTQIVAPANLILS